MVRAVGDVERRTTIAGEKHRRDERDVRQVRAALERIVQHDDVTRLHRAGVDRGSHRQRHRAQMHGHVIALRDRVAMAVVDRARVVETLLDVRREAGLPERDAHLISDGEKEVLEDLELDGMDARRDAGRHDFTVLASGVHCQNRRPRNRTPAAR